MRNVGGNVLYAGAVIVMGVTDTVGAVMCMITPPNNRVHVEDYRSPFGASQH